jgi:ABC-type glycerol-3-phosphate transport system substrate-binding protein
MSKNLRIRRELRPGAGPKTAAPFILLLLAVALLSVVACSAKQNGQTPKPDTASTAVPTTSPQATSAAPNASPTPGQSQISLRIWVSPEFAVAADSAVFGEIVSGFEAAYPGIQVELSAKRTFGRGGLLDLLQGAGQVALSYVPDLILMDDGETARAVELGLLEALDPLLATPVDQQVFSNILATGVSDGTRYGLPFALDFLQLAYRTSITSSAPLNWSTVLDSGGRYLFASGASDNYSSDAILIQYLGLDGTLTGADGKPTLDSRLLTRVLDAYKQVSDLGALATETLTLNSPDGVWTLYGLGDADFAEVWASQYKAEALSMSDTSFARIPTRNGRPATLAHVWAWSISARTPERQEAAASFLQWAMETSRQSAWCESARLLPASPNAWPLPGVYTEYSLFLLGLAEVASPFPEALRSEDVSAALQEALSQVISDRIAPKQAAEQAVAKMKIQ